MFDKMKQLKELRDMQQAAKAERVEGESNGVRVVLDGTLSVQEVSLNPQLSQGEAELAVTAAFNSAVQKVQMAMAQKMRGMM